jgi:hypothetical protein
VRNIRSTRSIRAVCVVAGVSLALVAGGVASSSAAQNLVLTLTGTPVAGGGTSTLTVGLTNNDSNDANPTTTLTLPSGVSYVSALNGAICTPDTPTHTVSCTHGTVTGGGGQDSFGVKVTPDASATGPITAAASDGALTSNTASLDVQTRADLVPSISALSGGKVAGASAGFDYTVTVHNAGPSNNVGGYKLTGTLPSDIVFGSAPGCLPATGGFTCSKTSGVPASGTSSTDTYTVHVSVLASACPGGVSGTPPCDGSETASVSVDPTPTTGTTDPNPSGTPPTGDDASTSVSIITRADLVPSISALSGGKVAGASAGFDYTVTVHNAGPSNNVGGYKLTGTLPSDIVFGSAPGCLPATGGFTCSKTSGVPASGTSSTDTYTVHVSVLASACPGGVSGTPPCDGSETASVSVDPTPTTGTTDPNPSGTPPTGDDASTSVSIITQANIHAISLTAAPVQPLLYAKADPAPNRVTYTFKFINNGPSYARSVNVTDILSSGKLVGLDYGFCDTADCVPTPDQTYPANGVMSIGDVQDGKTVTLAVRARTDDTFRNPSNTPALAPTSATVSSPTTDLVHGTPSGADETASESGVSIATVPSPVRNLQAIPGASNVILTWEPPSFTGGSALQTSPLHTYTITVTPGGQTFFVDVGSPNATQVTCPNGTATDCYRINIQSLSQTTLYTFVVQAQNDVGLSDHSGGPTPVGEIQAQPSADAAALIVPAAGQTLATCTTATKDQPTCVQYVVPSGGNGGVFGIQGHVSLANFVCGTFGSCLDTTGAQNLGALAGYDQPSKPLVMIINWDSITIPTTLSKKPVCSTNSTATNCFPNNLPIFYETSAFLAANDSHGATFLNAPSGPHGPYVTHFCSLPTNRGGAGNVNFARPKPYADTAGSACIKSISVLTGLPNNRPNDKGDVQVVINLTSDSDALAGHH